jgi:hypothetical protein
MPRASSKIDGRPPPPPQSHGRYLGGDAALDEKVAPAADLLRLTASRRQSQARGQTSGGCNQTALLSQLCAALTLVPSNRYGWPGADGRKRKERVERSGGREDCLPLLLRKAFHLPQCLALASRLAPSSRISLSPSLALAVSALLCPLRLFCTCSGSVRCRVWALQHLLQRVGCTTWGVRRRV